MNSLPQYAPIPKSGRESLTQMSSAWFHNLHRPTALNNFKPIFQITVIDGVDHYDVQKICEFMKKNNTRPKSLGTEINRLKVSPFNPDPIAMSHKPSLLSRFIAEVRHLLGMDKPSEQNVAPSLVKSDDCCLEYAGIAVRTMEHKLGSRLSMHDDLILEVAEAFHIRLQENRAYEASHKKEAK